MDIPLSVSGMKLEQCLSAAVHKPSVNTNPSDYARPPTVWQLLCCLTDNALNN